MYKERYYFKILGIESWRWKNSFNSFNIESWRKNSFKEKVRRVF